MASIVHDLSNVQRRAHRLCERNAVLHDLKRDDEQPPDAFEMPITTRPLKDAVSRDQGGQSPATKGGV